MTSVFDEKGKKRKKPSAKKKTTSKEEESPAKKFSPADVKTIIQMRQENYSIPSIAKLLSSQLNREVKQKEVEDALRGTSFEIRKRGRHSPTATVTKEDIEQALTDAVTELKKKVKKEDLKATKSITKLLGGLEAIYKLAHQKIQQKGKYIEYSNLKKALKDKKINLETLIGEKTEIIEAEKPKIDLEAQDEWSECFKDPEWSPGPDQILHTKQFLRQINDLIALKNAQWDLPPGIEVPATETEFPAFADFLRSSVAHIKSATHKDIPFVHKMNYKPISEWTKADIYWAFNYLDYVRGRGQLHPRVAVRRIQLFAYGNRWGKIDASRDKYSTPKSLKKATTSKEIKKYTKYQASKTESLKKVPTPEQIKPMLQYLRDFEYKGQALLQYSMEKGEELSDKQKAELERAEIDLATAIFMDTGCRMGWHAKTGLRSVEFSNLGKNETTNAKTGVKSTEYTMTLMEKKRKTEIAVPIDGIIIKKADALKAKLKKFGVKTDECKVINLDPSIMTEYYRNAAETAGLVKYIYKYGIKHKIPLTNKFYIEEFAEDDPRRNDPKFRQRVHSVLGHPLTETDTDMDFHAHLFRAFHLRMCAEAGIPFHQAVKEGVPWESIDVAFKFYAQGFKIDEDAGKKKSKIFSELTIADLA